jgi:hypothetical protein
LPKLDRLKEEMGLYKVIFSLFFVLASSLIAWIYQQKDIGILPIIAEGILIIAIFLVIIKIKNLLKEIERE